MKQTLLRTGLGLVVLLMASVIALRQGRKVMGRVVDATTRKPLKNAHVVIDGTSRGAATNYLGFFELTLNADDPGKITTSYIGFNSTTVVLPETGGVIIALDRKYEDLDPISSSNR